MNKNTPRINPAAKERGIRVAKLINMTGLSRKDFCLKYDIGTTTLRQWERPTIKGLTEKGAERLIRFAQQENIKCSFEWLYNGNGLPPYFEIEPVTDQQLSLGEKQHPDQSGLLECDESMNDEVKRFMLSVKNAVTVTISDAGLEPNYKIGDVVGGSFDSPVNANEYLNKVCIVFTQDNEIFVRKLTKTGNSYSLRVPNENAPKTLAREISDIEIKKISGIYRAWKKKIEEPKS